MESTEPLISTQMWCVSLLGLMGVILGVGVLAVALALGWQSPPISGPQALHMSGDLLAQLSTEPDQTRRFDGTILTVTNLQTPADTQPPTALLSAHFATASEWGVMSDNIVLAVAKDGHALAGPIASAEWRPFMHIQGDFNQLYFHQDGQYITLRINEEIIWQGWNSSPVPRNWALLYSPGTPPNWSFFDLYQPD